MKKMLIAAAALFSLSSFAGTCEVKSHKYPELTKGINKKTICNAVKLALFGSYVELEKDSFIVVSANRGRSMYRVELDILWTNDGSAEYQEPGLLIWYPNEAHVRLERD